MKLSICIALCLLYLSALGQETKIEEKLAGTWLMTKAVLVEEPLNSPQGKVSKEYTVLKEPLPHFLLNQCITQIHLMDDEFFVDIYSNRLKNPVIEEGNGLVMLKEDTGMSFGPYQFVFSTDDDMMARTSEVFYNSKAGKPMKAVLSVYLNKSTR